MISAAAFGPAATPPMTMIFRDMFLRVLNEGYSLISDVRFLPTLAKRSV